MKSLLEVLKELKKEGYTTDLNELFSSEQESEKENKATLPERFTVEKWYRIDEMSDPRSQTIVYAVSANNGSLKGVLVNGYGIYSDPKSDKIMERFDLNPNENTLPNEMH